LERFERPGYRETISRSDMEKRNDQNQEPRVVLQRRLDLKKSIAA